MFQLLQVIVRPHQHYIEKIATSGNYRSCLLWKFTNFGVEVQLANEVAVEFSLEAL